MLLFIIGLILFIALIVTHELGHFWVARRNGVKAEEFGIFFPPTLWRKKMKSGFDLTFNVLPLGGYVKLKGEYISDKRKGAFGAASDWAKTKIMLAGVAVNLVTAVVMFMILSWFGMPHIVPNQFVVASDAHYVSREKLIVAAGLVEVGSPADKAGLIVSDVILAIGSAETGRLEKIDQAEDLPKLTEKYSGQKVAIEYKRGDKNYETTATLRSDADVAKAKKEGRQIGRLGVTPGLMRDSLTVVRSTWSAPIVALGTTAQLTGMTFQGLGKALAGVGSMIAGAVTGNQEARQNGQTEAGQVGGPVAIFMTLKLGTELGLAFIIMIIAYLALMLAIMNVLPIPALDGGRLYVMLLAKLFKKELTPELEEKIYGGAFVFLLGLIVIITIVDVRRFF